jgi:hypothetical protein
MGSSMRIDSLLNSNNNLKEEKSSKTAMTFLILIDGKVWMTDR